MLIHTLIDGFALGAAISADIGEVNGWVGIGVFAAILMHKPLDALTISSLMIRDGWGKRHVVITNVALALVCPLGAALVLFGTGQMDTELANTVIGAAMAFAAGVFLCISLSDLLPEVQFHSHDSGKLTGLLLIGLLLAFMMSLNHSAVS